MKKILLLIGMPGAGKSSIGKICEKNGYTHISTSKLITQAGYDIKSRNYSNAIVIELIKNAINAIKDKSTIILEGFPRNMNQLCLLEQEFEITKAIYLKITKSIAMHRITERAICSGCGEIYKYNSDKILENNQHCNKCGSLIQKREGDNKKIFTKRASYFAKNSYPIIQYFRNKQKLIVIDASQSIDEIFNIIKTL